MSHHQYEEHACIPPRLALCKRTGYMPVCIEWPCGLWRQCHPHQIPPMPLATRDNRHVSLPIIIVSLNTYAVNHEWESWVPFGRVSKSQRDALMWSTHRLRFRWTVSGHHQHSVALVNLSIQSGNESEGASLWDETWCGDDSLTLWVTMQFL